MKYFPFFPQILSKVKIQILQRALLAWPYIIESLLARTDLGGTPWWTGDRPFEGEITISSQTRGDARFLRPNGDHFGQPERRAPGGPFLKYLLDQVNAWTNFNELLMLETFQQGNDNLFVHTQKNFNVSAANSPKSPESGCQRVIHCKK